MIRSGKMLGAVFCLAAGLSPTASGLTIGLDFVTGATSDMFGIGTTTADYTGYGFTGMSTAQIQQGILNAVIEDFLGYPTSGMNALSTLQNGLELNIDFVLSTNTGAPLNGDLEYYFVAIGANTTGNGFLGQACLGCVRSAASASIGALVGVHTGRQYSDVSLSGRFKRGADQLAGWDNFTRNRAYAIARSLRLRGGEPRRIDV